MQSYDFQLDTISQRIRNIFAQADLFVYESGVTADRINLCPYSEGTAAQSWLTSGVVDASATISGYNAALQFGDNSVQRWAYKFCAVQAGQYTLSFIVQMDDGSAPVVGSSASGDFSINFNGTLTNAGATVRPVFGKPGQYMVSQTGAVAASGTVNFGVYKATANSAKGFRVTAYQVETGSSPTAYIKNATAAALSSSDGDQRIIVTPDHGTPIVLRPGQRFRVAPGGNAVQRWDIAPYDQNTSIAGVVIIGSGEFDDANTKNVFKLDAQFANQVNVTNTTANPVPVTQQGAMTLNAATAVRINNSTADRVNVSLDPAQVLNIAGTSVQYTNSYSDSSVGNGTITLFNAAANLNGAWVELATVAISAAGGQNVDITLLAKATVPASRDDGDVYWCVCAATVNGTAPGATAVNEKLTSRIKVPPGKGLHIVQSAGAGAGVCHKNVLVTLL